MAALLRLAAMLVSHAVHPLRMLLTLLPRECHTDVERDRLPATETGNHSKEESAAAHSQLQSALMVSRPRSGRPSNHEGGLTGVGKASRHSADVLLPRSGVAPSARTADRSGPGGGPPHRLAAAPPVPCRAVQASRPMHASLPPTGEENHSRVTR